MPVKLTNRPDPANTRTTEPPSAGGNSFAVPGLSDYGVSNHVARRGLETVNFARLDLWSLNPFVVLDLAMDVFPAFGLAVHNIVRLVNPAGFEIICKNPNSGKEDARAAAMCDVWLSRANRNVECDLPGATGGVDALINALAISAYTRTGVCTEAVLTADLSDLDDIAYVDPFTIDFDEIDGKRGKFKMFQRQSGTGANLYAQSGKVELNPLLVTFVPFDDTLRGRLAVAPALQILPHWVAYYLKLQKYLQKSAIPYIDGKVKTEEVRKDWNALELEEREMYRDFYDYLVDVTNRLAADYKSQQEREPDGALFHPDIVELSALSTAQAVFPVEAAMKVCQREIFQALKMLPVFMGVNEGTTETHGTVQMAIFMAGIRRIQRMVAHGLERPLQLGFRASGYSRAVKVEIKFNEISTDDRMKIAKAVMLEIEAALTLRDNNAITQNDFAQRVTGSKAVGSAPLSGDADPDGPSAPVAGTNPQPSPNPAPDPAPTGDM